jgi:PAS domain-containing protein
MLSTWRAQAGAILVHGDIIGSVVRRQIDEPGTCYPLGFTSIVDGETVTVSLHRDKRLGRFDSDQVEAMKCLRPHITRAIRVSRRLTGARQRVEDIELALDQSAAAVALLDSRCVLRFANRSAREIFDARDGIWEGADGLRAATPELTSRDRRLPRRPRRRSVPRRPPQAQTG